MTYNYGAFDKVTVDWKNAQLSANARCKAWGYARGEAFGGAQTKCTYMSNSGCMQYQADITFQCTGEATKPVAPAS